MRPSVTDSSAYLVCAVIARDAGCNLRRLKPPQRSRDMKVTGIRQGRPWSDASPAPHSAAPRSKSVGRAGPLGSGVSLRDLPDTGTARPVERSHDDD